MNSFFLHQFLIDEGVDCSTDILVRDVTINLQEAHENTLSFYNLRSIEFLDIFLERLNNSSCQAVIIPRLEELFLDDKRIIQVSAEQFFHLQKKACDILYPLESPIPIVGITGTNGKTTVAYLAAQLATLAGVSSFAIGTLGLTNGYGEVIFEHKTTTPDYLSFRKELLDIGKQGGKLLFIELSSHALDQQRLQALMLEVAGWTNITQDHLDYHKNFATYLNAKLQIKELLREGSEVILARNSELIEQLKEYDFKVAEEISEYDICFDNPFFELSHNVENLELALSLIKHCGITIPRISLAQLKTPPGRLDRVELPKGVIAFVDFAHTPDALENVCRALKECYATSSLTVVFGCGGDRDRSKRPLMGAAVERWADRSVVTSDNPRSEDPVEIIDDILVGMENPSIVEPDRTRAIELAVEMSQEGEIILIAGKGHEDYQEIAGVKYPYSDFSVLDKIRKRDAVK